MISKKKITLYTFFSVAFIIFAMGFVGINFTIDFIKQKYVEIQLDVNRRHVENLSHMLSSELKYGTHKDTLVSRLQNSLEGTEYRKGFICMFDKTEAKMLCHPNPDMLGMQMPETFNFEQKNTEKKQLAREIIKSGKPVGGLLQKDEDTDITYMIPVKGTDWMLSAHENIAILQKELDKLAQVLTIGAVILGLLIAIAATWAARKISRMYEFQIEKQNLQLDHNLKELTELHNEVKTQKEEIETQRDYAEEQREKISFQNKQIKDSIQYAQQIQRAILPPQNIIQHLLPEHFILFLPRDIVSGDFYWMKEFDQQSIIIAADCTGHGVPGAFMSMLGMALLNEINSQKLSVSPAVLLNELRKKVKLSMRQTGQQDLAQDGMDIAVCFWDKSKHQVQFAGAFNPLVLIRTENGKPEIIQINADKMPIGIYHGEENSFTNHTLDVKTGDMIYLFSDGFSDQLGGEKCKKFLSKNFKKLLAEISSQPVEEQKQILLNTFKQWICEEIGQLDDVLVIGFRV